MATQLRSNQQGALNALLVPLILVIMLLIGAGAFAFWAFGQRQDYKNNVDAKIIVANQAAVKAEDAKKDAAFAQEAKNPLRTYNGPSDYGSIAITYPKTWSGYVDEVPAAADVNAYFYPGVVPNLTTQSSTFALRMQILNQDYGDILQQYSGNVKTGTVTSAPYALPKLPKIVGTRLDGVIFPNKTGSLILLPLRDKTIEIWTESPQFIDDFNKIILPNFTFSP